MEKTLVVADDIVVGLDYTLTVDGEIVDSTENSQPLEYLQGHRNIISGLENALVGMAVGDSKDVVVSPADGYGEITPEAFVEVERSNFPEDMVLEVGRNLQVGYPDGRVANARIHEIGEDKVKLDMNHPMAGKELHFRAEVVSLRPATDEELMHERLGGGGCGSCQSSCGSQGCC